MKTRVIQIDKEKWIVKCKEGFDDWKIAHYIPFKTKADQYQQ